MVINKRGPLEASQEKRLVERCQRGDRDAFSELVLVYEVKVRQLARRLVGDAELADDLAQQAFLSAYQSLNRFRGESRFSTWIYRITVNVCGMHLRRARLLRFAGEEAMIELADRGGGPLFGANQTLLRERLEEAMPRLSWPQRQAIALFYLEGVSYSEIAEILNAPVGTVKAWISRGLVKLRSILNEEKLQ